MGGGSDGSARSWGQLYTVTGPAVEWIRIVPSAVTATTTLAERSHRGRAGQPEQPEQEVARRQVTRERRPTACCMEPYVGNRLTAPERVDGAMILLPQGSLAP